MMAQYGRDTWRSHGETFSVWFATLGRLAPLALDGRAGREAHRRDARSGLLEPGLERRGRRRWSRRGDRDRDPVRRPVPDRASSSTSSARPACSPRRSSSLAFLGHRRRGWRS